MMPAPQRDEVVLCKFPFSETPTRPGPVPHFGLVIESFEHKGVTWVVLAYGTTRNDNALQNKHPNILDVRQEAVSGMQMEAKVTHFLCDRLAVLPWTSTWFRDDIKGHLVKTASTPADKQFLQDLERAHKALDKNALSALRAWMKTERAGLVTGVDLR